MKFHLTETSELYIDEKIFILFYNKKRMENSSILPNSNFNSTSNKQHLSSSTSLISEKPINNVNHKIIKIATVFLLLAIIIIFISIKLISKQTLLTKNNSYQKLSKLLVTPISNPSPSNTKTFTLEDNGKQAKIECNKNSYEGSATFEISSLPSTCKFLDNYRETGVAVGLKLLEWVPPQGKAIFPFTFNPYCKIEMSYNSNGIGGIDVIKHLDKNKLIIVYCDPDKNIPKELPSIVDGNKKIVKSNLDRMGTYQIFGPLLCQEDRSEPYDDDFNMATLIGLGARRVEQKDIVFGEKIKKYFDVINDEDWFKFSPDKGKTYILETSDLASKVGTIIYFYDEGLKLINSNDNSNLNDLSSKIEWTSPDSGEYYYIQIKPSSTSSAGCRSSYNFSISFKLK